MAERGMRGPGAAGEDFFEERTIDELRDFSKKARRVIEDQKRALEVSPLARAVLSDEIKLPLEVQLLAQALFHIDREASDILARSLSVSGAPKKDRSSGPGSSRKSRLFRSSVKKIGV